MAKTTSQVSVTQGSGSNLSTYTLTSGRVRETVILADADADGEELLAELPAHDSADRGSPLKIGGKASASPFSAVTELDRTDAWFTLNGQQAVVTTLEPATVYDGGRRSISNFRISSALDNAGVELVAATASVRTKLLAVTVSCIAFTGAGVVHVTGPDAFFLATITAVGQSYLLSGGGLMIMQTGVNTALTGFFVGNGTINFSVTYYQAP